MAKGSARQRKKLAKRLAQKTVHTIAPVKEQPIAQAKQVTVTPTSVRIAKPKEELPATVHTAQQQYIKKKKRKRLNRKQRKRLKLQQRKLQQAYRDKAQERYYEEHTDKQYTNEADDMTEEYANNILDDLNRLADSPAKERLLDIFYSHYNAEGGAYIQALHDTGADANLHDVVEVAIAKYKGNIPEKYYMAVVSWLNVGAPVDMRNTGADDDTDDISSEMYE